MGVGHSCLSPIEFRMRCIAGWRLSIPICMLATDSVLFGIKNIG